VDGDVITALYALRPQMIGQAIGALVQVAVTQADRTGDQGQALGYGVDYGFEQVGEVEAGLAVHSCGSLG
jgi:hypothetical protein